MSFAPPAKRDSQRYDRYHLRQHIPAVRRNLRAQQVDTGGGVGRPVGFRNRLGRRRRRPVARDARRAVRRPRGRGQISHDYELAHGRRYTRRCGRRHVRARSLGSQRQQQPGPARRRERAGGVRPSHEVASRTASCLARAAAWAGASASRRRAQRTSTAAAP